jgi:hypothetical protein
MLSAETGIKIKLGGKQLGYAGVFFDYGLNKARTPQGDDTYISYNPTNLSNATTNSLLSLNSVTKSKVIAYGIALKLGWGIKNK